MRRLALSTIAILALLPGTALAHHHRHHRHHHGANRVRNFTPRTDSSNIGTVTSFDGSTLVITLNNGSTVSGAVTDATRIQCDSAGGQGDTSSASLRDDGGDNQGDGDANDQGANDTQSGDDANDQADVNDQQGDDNGQGDDDANDNRGDDEGQDNGSCSAADLQPGTVVHEARLDLTGTGPTFDKVELVK